MFYQQDWLLRQIRRLGLAISNYLLQTESNVTELWTDYVPNDDRSVSAWLEIDDFLEKNDYCGAENLLYAWADGDDPLFLGLAVRLYSALNQKTDEDLQQHDYSREEILDGLREICRIYGFDTQPYDI